MENNVEHEVGHLSNEIQRLREEIADLRLKVKMVYHKYLVPVYHGGDQHLVTISEDGTHLSCVCHEFVDAQRCAVADAINNAVRGVGFESSIEYYLPNGVHWWAHRID